jgi:hypothetical protein
VRKLKIAIAQYRYILASQSAAMDSSRKRKATNATPSQTDGSATKKIKLVVRVLLVYTLFLDIDRVTRSRVDGQRIGVCVRRWCWVCDGVARETTSPPRRCA